MNGGARPMLVWALLLSLSGLLNLVWAGVSVQTATFSAAVLAIVVTAVGILIRRAGRGPEPVTHASFGTMIAAVGVGALLFGLVFGHFIIYFGSGLIVAGLGRLLLELRAQRRAMRGGDS